MEGISDLGSDGIPPLPASQSESSQSLSVSSCVVSHARLLSRVWSFCFSKHGQEPPTTSHRVLLNTHRNKGTKTIYFLCIIFTYHGKVMPFILSPPNNCVLCFNALHFCYGYVSCQSYSFSFQATKMELCGNVVDAISISVTILVWTTRNGDFGIQWCLWATTFLLWFVMLLMSPLCDFLICSCPVSPHQVVQGLLGISLHSINRIELHGV